MLSRLGGSGGGQPGAELSLHPRLGSRAQSTPEQGGPLSAFQTSRAGLGHGTTKGCSHLSLGSRTLCRLSAEVPGRGWRRASRADRTHHGGGAQGLAPSESQAPSAVRTITPLAPQGGSGSGPTGGRFKGRTADEKALQGATGSPEGQTPARRPKASPRPFGPKAPPPRQGPSTPPHGCGANSWMSCRSGHVPSSEGQRGSGDPRRLVMWSLRAATLDAGFHC